MVRHVVHGKPQERSDDQIDDLKNSVVHMKRLILEEANLVGNLNKIILCGISQGAATALCTLFDVKTKLCGFLGFATWLPEYCKIERGNPALRTPKFMAHNRNDDVINIDYGVAAREHLNSLGGEVVEWHRYNSGGHWMNELNVANNVVHPSGIDDMVKFMQLITGTFEGNYFTGGLARAPGPEPAAKCEPQ